jgi:osmotically-inducible protein OsmY
MTSTHLAIREEILAECERQSWAPMIKVVVHGGIVELHGAITDDRERQALIVASENVCVAAVHDYLVWIEPTAGFVMQSQEDKEHANAS